MKPDHFFIFLAALVVSLMSTSFCYGNDGHPKSQLQTIIYKQIGSLLNDTVPEVKKIPEPKTDSSVNRTAIKEVPKSKKQIAPIAVPVTVKVKPIRIIKPKIIRPVIKIN